MPKQTPTTEITTEEQAEQARTRVADLTRTIDDLDAQHADVSQRIGEALAAIELGDKTAKTTAGKLALKRSGLDAERRDLALTRDALRANVAAWDAAEAARRGKQALTDLAKHTAAARDLEARLGEQLIAAAETAQHLQETATAWRRARREAGRVADVTTFTAPRVPAAAGLRPDLITDPGRTVARWLGQTPPPRPATTEKTEQERYREASRIRIADPLSTVGAGGSPIIGKVVHR